MTKQEAMFKLALKEAGVMFKEEDIEIDHKKARNYYKDVEYNLIFPWSFVDKAKRLWREHRQFKYNFIGNITSQRKWVLNFESRNSFIKDSKLGRTLPKELFDEETYYNILADSEFTLCPAGSDADKGYVWTYRFFEAIMCGSIPVVDIIDHSTMDDFKFYTVGQKHLYDKSIVEYNYNNFIRKHVLPRNLVHENWFIYKDFYNFIISHLDFKRFAEVGVWKGDSLSYLASKVKNRKDAEVYGIDIFEDNYNFKKQPNLYKQIPFIYNEYQSTLKRHGVLNFVKTIKSLSWDAASLFNNNYFDFVFIDADHSYQSVKKDIVSWLPKVRSGGILAGHDYNPRANNGDVIRCVNEIFGKEVKTFPGFVWYIEKEL